MIVYYIKMQNTDDYKDKYLKYKHKYLQLAGALNQQHMRGGGCILTR